ncbi:MAPEG family protein [Microbulbifer magnicolonia]|uniref:MAPEG family protein n=1 Tax=Microbulbifer magnicolonia TaxID=3109744 RepID=UPI002B400DFB|nr:MAPEG family protein [Microbulbifer sp. GG15]
MTNVTALYAGLYAILIIVLAFRVVQFRRTEKIGLGSGERRENEVRVRVHANAVENIPIALILMVIAELGGLAALWLYILGGLFLLGRLMHAIGLTVAKGGYHPGRFWGTAISWTVILILAVIDIGFALI